MANLSAVPDQIDMQGVDPFCRNHFIKDIVGRVRTNVGADEPETF
jgi:hypothetical protein